MLKVVLCLMLAFTTPAVQAAAGEKIYDANCKACHSSPRVRAPQLGDKKEWQERLDKGKTGLVESVVKGMQGYVGAMPPRAGNPKLTDADIEAAVQYIIDSVK